MESIQRGPVAYADHCNFRHRNKKGVELRFCFFIHGRSGFIEEDPFRAVQEDTDEGESLLFSKGEDMTPVSFFVQMIRPLGKAAFFHEGDDFFRISFMAGVKGCFF